MLTFQADEFFYQHKQEIIGTIKSGGRYLALREICTNIYKYDTDKDGNPRIYFKCDGMRDYRITIKKIDSEEPIIETAILSRPLKY